MLFLFAFEPDATEDDIRRGSQYMTKKDLRAMIAIGVIVIIILVPLYDQWRKQRDKTVCSGNMRAIGNAIGAYATANNDRFPPVHAFDPEGNVLTDNELPITWATVVQPDMSRRFTMICPSAKPEEITYVRASESATPLGVTYGMYVEMDLESVSLLDNPSRTVLLAETSNGGSQNTYNPLPLMRAFGTPVDDGYLIGYDDDNYQHSALTKSVTRLAFYNSASGNFRAPGIVPRHDGGIFAIMADGSLSVLTPGEARVEYLEPELIGIWRTRPGR